MGLSRSTFVDTLLIDAIWKKEMGICPEMKGGHCLRKEFWEGKEFRGYYQANCSQATVAFRFDSKILAYPPYPATEKTLLPNNSDPSSVAAKPICYLRGFEKKWVLPFEMKTAYNLPQKW